MNRAHFPESPGAHEHLGDLLARAGASDEARRHYEHALALDPEDEELREKRSGLEGGREIGGA